MDKRVVKANFRTVDFDNHKKLNSVVVYGAVRNHLRTHTYFIFDLWHSKCHIVDLSNLYTLQNFYRCLKTVERNNYKDYKSFPLLRTLFQDGTYTLKQFGVLVGANIPHHIRYIGDKRFWIGNVGTHNALICDLEKQQVTSIIPDTEDVLLGPQISYDEKTGEVFFLTYGINGHLQLTLVDPQFKNRFSIRKWNPKTDEITTVWSDDINCMLVDGFRVTADQSYAIFSDLRFALDKDCQFDLNAVYVVDLKTQKTWEIPGLKGSAHVEPDPDDPSVFYISEHQIGIIVRDHVTEEEATKNEDLTLIARVKFVTKEVGGFVGAAALHKYRMTPEGPVLLGTYAAGKDFLRATWHFAFKNRGRKYIASISSPYIVIIDAETMTLHKKIDTGLKPLYGLQVSEDGEQFYCNCFFDFLIVDFETGKVQATFSFGKERDGHVFHISAHTLKVDHFF
ncbi:YncE family protein [Thiorhodovibrio frisius]|uniref:Methanethiol oxidase n=1 Tax=Thiorhodovibrio frisius TaxID=631362 RepID=H8Z3R5_9GAMM|nr:hypothetical protein [Thiorhodovibrio frisius]EIC20054.1 hypothetical protein Thi970DRAFT_03666 [Thiorhodovibrio frisius]WPL20782.1 hypothetical protein Thiofri_00886 [Thiorhodovibrio frisius]